MLAIQDYETDALIQIALRTAEVSVILVFTSVYACSCCLGTSCSHHLLVNAVSNCAHFG
jgi:hypothetical protein